MHAHLDALGGISGDMFLASLLDAHPDLVEPLISLLNTLPLTAIPPISVTNGNENHGLRGSRFSVGEVPAQGRRHTPWAEIQQWLCGSSLP